MSELIGPKDLTGEERQKLAERLGVSEETLLNDPRFDPDNYETDDPAGARLRGALGLSKMLSGLQLRRKKKGRVRQKADSGRSVRQTAEGR